MSITIPLVSGNYYHVFNRGNNRENIFREPDNYRYFLKRYFHYMPQVIDTYAYCLLKNHFHLLIRVKTDEEQEEFIKKSGNKKNKISTPKQRFSNLFNSYAKSFNAFYHRTGHLFEERFRRKPIDSQEYLLNTLYYIHYNPAKHRFIDDYKQYPYTSYHLFMDNGNGLISQQEVFEWFNGKDNFMDFHTRPLREDKAVVIEEDD